MDEELTLQTGGAHDVPSHGDALGGSAGPEAYENKPGPGDAAVVCRVDYMSGGAASHRTANALGGTTTHDNANVPNCATSERVADTLGDAASILIAAGGLVAHGAVVNCAAGVGEPTHRKARPLEYQSVHGRDAAPSPHRLHLKTPSSCNDGHQPIIMDVPHVECLGATADAAGDAPRKTRTQQDGRAGDSHLGIG